MRTVPAADVWSDPASRVSQSPFPAPSSNHDGGCPLNLTLSRRFCDGEMTQKRQTRLAACERGYGPLNPSIASSCRCRPTCMARPESAYRRPAHRADCRGDARARCGRPRAASPWAGMPRGVLDASRAPRARAQSRRRDRSLLRPEAARIWSKGPSGFGESTAFERSRPRNSSARYSSATAKPLHASSIVQMRAVKTFFRTIGASRNTQKREYDLI